MVERSELSCVYWQEGQCLLDRPSCKRCRARLTLDDPAFVSRWKDPLLVTDRHKQPTESLRGLLAGCNVFLVCGGPSGKQLDLSLLNQRGVWTMAVNNMAAHKSFRPNAFVCADPPRKFHHAIWLDPAIMKFVPTVKLRSRRGYLRRKMPDGSFCDLGRTVSDCPNVWGFKRESWLWPDERFFLSKAALWGNHDVGVKKTGEPKGVSTMLLALRLLAYLGAKRIFLVGVDFRMTKQEAYSFEQERSDGEVAHNNRLFSVVNDWLCRMESDGVFRKFGVEIYNCYQRSGLRAFPYVPYPVALRECWNDIEHTIDLSRWYDDEEK